MDQTPKPHITAYLGHLFDQLKFMKQQQWAITNYGVLILAAIYAINLAPLGHARPWLKVLAVGATVVGSCLLLRIQDDMSKVRRRLQTLLTTYFTPDELKGVGLTDEEINDLIAGKRYSWRRGMEFTGALMAVLLIGAILVCFAL
jgi:hypothetical protein